MRPASLLLLSISLTACLGSGTLNEEGDCAQLDGRAVLERSCLNCHASTLTGRARGGAPEGIDFDADADVARHAAHIRTVLADETMPLSGPLPACEEALLLAYVATTEEGPCEAACAGRVCGSDGCEGSCGDCPAGEACAEDVGQCIPAECVPACAGLACGSDGCGGSCGDCAAGERCEAGACVPEACLPACEGKVCGADGCGATCGACAAGESCAGGACTPDGCVPACEGKVCGDDGCGGLCGDCAAGEACTAGACGPPPPSFSADVFPIFTAKGCAASTCHAGARPDAGLDLRSAGVAWAELVDVRSTQCVSLDLVEPGDPAASYLINKLTGVGMCGQGFAMPRGVGATRLTAAQLDAIRAWITGGAAP